ncbi:MAG: hypothetical protein K1X57_05330 [Gemmataceae bacterium]|nr:hypothetical protein [Gemmataceae bacterium]
MNRTCQFVMALSLAFSAPSRASAQAKVTFDQNVLPLLKEKCLNCHNADKARGGLDASTFGKLMEGGSSGAVVKPGEADGSRLYTLAAHREEPKMPPNSPPIAKESLDLLKAWIDGGALENAGSKAAVIKKTDLAAKSAKFTRPAVMPMPEKSLLRPYTRTARSNAVTGLTANPWSPIVAVAAPHQVLLFHVDTLDLVGILPFAHGQINVLKFSRSGELLLAAGGKAGKSGKAVVYTLKSGEPVTELGDETDAITAADLSPDQREVAVGGPGRVIRVYSTADGSKLHTMKKHTEWVTALEYSPDGKYLASGDRNGGVVLWEAGTGREHQTLPGHKLAVTNLAWRDDGAIVASSSEEGNVKLWEPEEGKSTRTIAAAGAQAVRYTHDGRIATTGRDGKTRLFDGNGAVQREYSGAFDMTLNVAVSHDQTRILAGDWTGTVHVWNLTDGKKVGTLNTNPPTREERIQAARNELTARQAVTDIAKKAYDQANAAVDAANKDLTQARENTARLRGEIRTLTERATKLKQANDKLVAEVAAQTKLIASLEAKPESAEKAKDKGDPAKLLADARAKLAELSAQQKKLAEELSAARKAREEAPEKVKQAQAAEGPKVKAVQTAEKNMATAKAAWEEAKATCDAASAEVDRLTRAQ